jgi:hypothetical protein
MNNSTESRGPRSKILQIDIIYNVTSRYFPLVRLTICTNVYERGISNYSTCQISHRPHGNSVTVCLYLR